MNPGDVSGSAQGPGTMEGTAPTPAVAGLTPADVHDAQISAGTKKNNAQRMKHLVDYLTENEHTAALDATGEVNCEGLTSVVWEEFLVKRGKKDNGNTCSKGHLGKVIGTTVKRTQPLCNCEASHAPPW